MTMPLIKRNNKTTVSNDAAALISSSSRNSKRTSKTSVLTQSLVVLGMVCAVGYLSSDTSLSSSPQTHQNQNASNQFPIDTHATLLLDLPQQDNLVSLGPHTATLRAKKTDCPNLGFWLRLEGDALQTVLLVESGDSWKGTFEFPIAGKYELVAYWKGCDPTPNTPVQRIPLQTVSVGGDASTNKEPSSKLFPKSAWISSKKFRNVPKSTPYVWHDPTVPTSDATLITTTNSTVSKQGATFQGTGFHSFRQLSNYELVCWVGSRSAQDSRTIFLEERRAIAAGQRPFKFHIYPSNNFVHPAEQWAEAEESRFRKCKHILVSIDQIQTPLSQQEYANQVTTFIHHLLKAFPDETFPIWMFTVNESPMTSTNCLAPYFLPRTSDHPCNDVLKDLFAKKTFPDRVHLLDNTALSLPQLGENLDDVQAAIALRIFVFVGKKVQEWRASGQEGRIDGLHRGDTVEPNFDLAPYPDWK
jgi:hypothetical protein